MVWTGSGCVGLGIDHADLDPVQRRAHRAGLVAADPVACHDRRTLGDPVAFQDRGLGGHFGTPREHGLRAFLRPRDDDPQRLQILRRGAAQQVAQEGGRGEQLRGPVPGGQLDQRRASVGSGMMDHPHAQQERREDAAGQPETVKRREESQQCIVTRHRQHVDRGAHVVEHIAMAERHRFGSALRT